MESLLHMIQESEVIGALALVSAIAASLAALFSWRQLRGQKQRWTAEDARKSPQIYIGLSGEPSLEGWFHGVWQVTNRADYEVELLRIEARSPATLRIGALDPATDGPVKNMKVMNPGKVLETSNVILLPRLSHDYSRKGKNFLYKISDKPERDRGKTIRLRFHIREVENPSIRYVKDGCAVVPGRNHA
jgi:hypothetical protein